MTTFAKSVALLLMASALLASVASASETDLMSMGEMSMSRKLLGATDNRFQFYTKSYPNKNVMVCKSCDATNLQGATVAGTSDGGFKIFVIDSGIITRQGDGGTDNWQFRGCFTRGGNQGSIVTFKKC